MDADGVELFNGLLEYDISKRISAKAAMRSAYFSELGTRTFLSQAYLRD